MTVDSDEFRTMLAIAGAAMGLVIVLSTFLPGAPYVPEAVSLLPFVLVFPLFGWAVIERRGLGSTKATPKVESEPRHDECGLQPSLGSARTVGPPIPCRPCKCRCQSWSSCGRR